MSDAYLGYQNPTTVDKKLDTEELTVGANVVNRERVQISGSSATDIAPVSASTGLYVNARAIAAGDTTIGRVKLTDGTTVATVRDLPANDALNVALVDASGNQVTSFGGGQQYADGTARGTATGTLSMGDDGTYIQSLKCDSNGVLAIQDNGGALTVDGTVSISGTPNVAVTSFPDNEPFNLAQYGGSAVGATNALHVQAGTGATFPVTDNSGSLTVDNGGTFAVQAAQSGTWNITNISGTISLPTGAATSANQTGGGQKTQVVDGSGNVIGSTSNALDVNIKSEVLVSRSYKETDCASSGDNTVHTPAGGKAIRLFYVSICNASDTALTVIIKFGAGGTTQLKCYIPASGGTFAHHFAAGAAYIQGAADAVLIANLSAAKSTYVNIGYAEI